MASHRRRGQVSFNLWTILIFCLSSSISAEFPLPGNVANVGGQNVGFAGRGGQLQNDERLVDTARQQGAGQQGQVQFQQGQPKQAQQQQGQPQYGQIRQNSAVPPNPNRPYNQLPQQGQQNLAAPKRTGHPIKISEHPDCASDVRTLCSSSSLNNNFAVLDCLQNDVKV